MENIKTEQIIKSRLDGALPEVRIKMAIESAVQEARDAEENRKLSFTVKCVCEVKPDDTIEVEAWAEIAKKQVEKTEKIGETIDLRQTTIEGV